MRVIFTIYKTSGAGLDDPPPCAGAFRDPADARLWCVDVSSVEALCALAEAESLVLTVYPGERPSLEIYDDYLE